MRRCEIFAYVQFIEFRSLVISFIGHAVISRVGSIHDVILRMIIEHYCLEFSF